VFQHLQIKGEDDSTGCNSMEDQHDQSYSNHSSQQSFHPYENNVDNTDDPNKTFISNTISRNDGASSVASSIINLLNTVAGAGMLGLPAAYAGSGYIGGTIMMFLAAYFSANGLQLLSFSADTAREKFIGSHQPDSSHSTNSQSATEGANPTYKASFYSVAQAALPEFTILIDFAVAIKCFGVATGYFITVADCMVQVFVFFLSPEKDSSSSISKLFISRQFWVITALLLVLPISFFKTLDSLKFTSLFSLILIYSLAIGIVFYAQGILDPCPITENGYPPEVPLDQLSMYDHLSNTTSTNPATCHGSTEYFSTPTDTLSNLPIFVFSFTCHQNIFSIYNELSNRTQSRLKKVISTSILSALFLYSIVAMEGYKTFGNHVKGDILLNYPQTMEVTLMRIGIAIMVILSYPLQLDPSRRCILSLIHEINNILENRRQQKRMFMENRSDKEMVSVQMDRSSCFTDSFSMDILSHADSEMHSRSSSITGPNDEVSEQDANNVKVNHPMEEMQLLTTEENPFSPDVVNNIQTNDNHLFYVVTCFFLLGSFFIAMLVSNLGLILAIVGATGSTMVSYILPGAIYLQLHPEQSIWNQKWKRLAYIQLVLGFAIVPTALYFVLWDGASA